MDNTLVDLNSNDDYLEEMTSYCVERGIKFHHYRMEGTLVDTHILTKQETRSHSSKFHPVTWIRRWQQSLTFAITPWYASL